MSRPATALLFLLTMPLAAIAATPIDQTVALSPGALVQIENVKGRISVTAWDRSEAHIGGTLGDGVEKLLVRGGGDRLLIRVEYPQQQGWFGWGNGSGGGDSTLEIRLPRSVALEIEAVSADVDVTGTDGKRLSIEAVSGDVTVDAAAAEATVETVSGDQDLRIATRDLGVETVSGDVRVRGAIDGRIHAEAVSGTLHLAGGSLKSVDASTVSGDIDVSGQLAAGGRVGIEALSGDVSVELSGPTSARVSAGSFSGSIRSSVGTAEKSEYGPGTSLDTTVGDGAGQIELETFSGDIRLELD